MKIQPFEQYVLDCYQNGEFDVPSVEFVAASDEIGSPRAATFIRRKLGDSAVTESLGLFKYTLVQSDESTVTANVSENGVRVISEQRGGNRFVTMIHEDGSMKTFRLGDPSNLGPEEESE